MRRLLGTLVLVPVLLSALGACGSDNDSAADPAPTQTTSAPSPTTATPIPSAGTATDTPTTVPPGTPPTKSPPLDPSGVSFKLLEIVSATGGGGESATDAVPITSDGEAEAFAATFSPDLASDLTKALSKARRVNGPVYAAVVGLGCDVPPGVVVSETSRGFEIAGRKVSTPTPECFAPVTSVAIVAITG